MNLGIDFGTTNSSIAFVRRAGQPPECASVDQYSNLPFDVVLRSAVLLDQCGRVVPRGIGRAALDPLFDPKTRARRRLLENFKPFLRTFRLRETWPAERSRIDFDFYDHLRQEPGVVTYKDVVESGDVDCSREELLTAGAAIFQTLFQKTPASVLQQKPQIIVGVPLLFPDYGKKRLLNIVVRSGIFESHEPYREALQCVRFLPEPIAASVLYALDCEPPRGRESGRVLVFDSGGGTLDLALLEFAMVDGGYRPVKQLALGSEVLAGKRYDECIERHALRPHYEAVLRWNATAADPAAVTRWQFAQAAESIKVALSTRQEYDELSLIGAGVRPRVTRREFEQWCADLLIETTKVVRSVVREIDAVDTVVMVGGSSLIPCVQRLMQDLFPTANVVHEDPARTGRGEGVERALTAVSKGLTLYDEEITSQGITPFAYGFWDMGSGKVIPAAPKWSSHKARHAVVAVPVAAGSTAATLTLVQELVAPERVLNVVNVPVHRTNGDQAYLHARVKTSDGAMYPDIELIDPVSGHLAGQLRTSTLDEHTLRRLIEQEDHVVSWPGATRSQATPIPEIVDLKVGDFVEFRERDAGREFIRTGNITRIDKIADGLRYAAVSHWDLRRWRFYVQLDERSHWTFVPERITDITLARPSAGTRNGRLRRLVDY